MSRARAPRHGALAVFPRLPAAGGRTRRGLAWAVLSALVWITDGAAAQAPPAAVTVTARVTVAEISVGEPFTVELRAEGPAGTTWSFPAQAGTPDVELVTEPAPSPSPGASPPPAPPPGTWRYRATVFTVKDVQVPAVSVRYRLPDGTQGEATSASVPLRLRSLLPKEPKEQTLADVHPPVSLSVGWPFWAASAVLVTLLAALAVWFVRRRRRSAPVATPATPPVEADVEALRALDELAASGALEREEYRRFYIALAEIAKRYLERRLSSPVLEMTSSETLALLRAREPAAPLAGTMRDLMGAADQVKFARGEGQAGEARRHLEAARALVHTLESRLRPAPETTGGAPR